MNLRSIINKTIILSFFGLAGWLLARSFYYGSFWGIILALVAIVAWSYFLYQLSKVQSENETEADMQENY
jgi:Zn-dependent protease with chaperone function